MELIEENPIAQAALMRTQRFLDEATTIRLRVERQGKNPDKVKAVTKAEAEYSGALTILAHVLGAAGADVLIENVPSHSLASEYLAEWDRQRYKKAMHRALKG